MDDIFGSNLLNIGFIDQNFVSCPPGSPCNGVRWPEQDDDRDAESGSHVSRSAVISDEQRSSLQQGLGLLQRRAGDCTKRTEMRKILPGTGDEDRFEIMLALKVFG